MWVGVKHLRDLAILPGEMFKYKWTVMAEDGPTKSDPRCLTRYYSSSIDRERDLASGLIGPLLICYKESVDQRGNQVGSLFPSTGLAAKQEVTNLQFLHPVPSQPPSPCSPHGWPAGRTGE